MTPGRLYRLLWVLIFAAAVLVRAPALIGRCYWLDEIITRNTALLPLWAPGAFHTTQGATHSILGFCLHDTGPGPLTYMIEGSFSHFAEIGGSEFWLRIPGIASSLLLLLLIHKRGRVWCGGRAGSLLAGSLAAVYPEAVDWSTGARGYGWTFLLAFLQLDLLTRLAGRSERSPRLVFALFCILSGFSILFHVIHVLWTGTLFLAAVLLFSGAKPCSLKQMHAWKFAAGLSAIGVAHLAWLLPWRTALAQNLSTFTAGITPYDIIKGVHAVAGQFVHNPEITFVVLWSLVVGLLFLMRDRTMPAALRMIIPMTAALSLALWILLTLRLFTAPRYFYAAGTTAIWLGGIASQRIWHWLNRRNATAADGLRYGIPLLVLLVCIKPAANAAGTPVHNWAAAASWLKARALPGDVFVCGPNSDEAVFVPYVTAMDVRGTPVRIVTDAANQRFDVYTEPGLRTLLESGKRVWFVTAFYGRHRTPGYWKLIAGNFRMAAKIPGKGEIFILLHEDR